MAPMGRTVRPVRYEIDAQLQELRKYLFALRREDRVHIEQLMVDVKKHISSMTYAHPINPAELMQWSALLELEKKVARLEEKLLQVERYR